MNNTVTASDSELKSPILDDLPNYNLLYIITHADPGILGDCVAGGPLHQETNTPAHYMGAFQDPDPNNPLATLAARVAAKGQYTPALPPYRLLFVLGCEAAGHTQIIQPGGPGTPDVLGPFNKDHSLAQAFGVDDGVTDAGFLGFGTLVAIDQHNVDWCDAVLDNLARGSTLGFAMLQATNDSKGKPDGWDDGPAQAVDNNNPFGAFWAGQAVPVIYGDKTMTLFHSVYGGQAGNWYTGG